MKRGLKIAWAFLMVNLYCIRYFYKGYQIETLRWHVTQKICLIRVSQSRGDGTWKYGKEFYTELNK